MSASNRRWRVAAMPTEQLESSHRCRVLYTDYAERFDEGLQALQRWLDDGSLKVTEDVLHGLEKVPEGLIGVLNGVNVGKRMIHVADPS